MRGWNEMNGRRSCLVSGAFMLLYSFARKPTEKATEIISQEHRISGAGHG